MVTSISVALMEKKVVNDTPDTATASGAGHHGTGRTAHILQRIVVKRVWTVDHVGHYLNDSPESSQQPVIDDLEKASHGFSREWCEAAVVKSSSLPFADCSNLC